MQEVFGIGTKISLVKPDKPKPETSQTEPTSDRQEPPQLKDKQIQSENQDENGATDTSGMVEDVDFNSAGCVTGNCSKEEPSKEIDVKDILNDPMVKKAQELFAAKKIVIRSKV